ncbi:hypothetical protein [Rickettsia endosymbiont of Polydrusus tereticollis]|uniref:hypothetical protein n=1 Tax=Rickettsia endosymbiont of Polydrusus tereticollis TaxID=3066251 RepID=UPI0031333193
MSPISHAISGLGSNFVYSVFLPIISASPTFPNASPDNAVSIAALAQPNKKYFKVFDFLEKVFFIILNVFIKILINYYIIRSHYIG